MDFHRTHRLTVELADSHEIDSLRQIVRLAHERLSTASTFRGSGSPVTRCAGLIGQELNRVQEAIERLASIVELDLDDATHDAEAIQVSVIDLAKAGPDLLEQLIRLGEAAIEEAKREAA